MCCIEEILSKYTYHNKDSGHDLNLIMAHLKRI